MNLDEYKSIETDWIASYVNGNKLRYFNSFLIEYIPRWITKFIGNKNITINCYSMQTYDSAMCGYFCIMFIHFMPKNERFYLSSFKESDNRIFSVT